MLFHEIFSLFSSLDFLLTEGFKDDMYRLYPEDKNNTEFAKAIKNYNESPRIKEAIKQKITINGNIANSIKSAYPTSADFINLISTIVQEISTKEKEKQEYKNIKQGKFSGNETDYWMIPCHTYEDLHKAAFKYTGNLPRLSNEEIKNKYKIEVPKSGIFYRTDKSPEEFLEYMKKENRFFMTPSWCIAGSEKGQDYFDSYDLTTEKDENPLCYIFISKKYPNIRFCVTLREGRCETNSSWVDDERIKVIKKYKLNLLEVRDPWQIGRGEALYSGLEMIKYAFGPKIKEVLDNICAGKVETNVISLSELVHGTDIFKNKDITNISASFDKLVGAQNMFTGSSITSINCKFPILKDGAAMFNKCKKLIAFDNELPSLTNGNYMFNECDSLKEFDTDLPKLEIGEKMFNGCSALGKFESYLPKLTCANSMFRNCRNLKKFICDLTKLAYGKDMFFGCNELKTFIGDLSNLKENGESFFAYSGLRIFKGDLSNLISGKEMFFRCKNLEKFDTQLPNLKHGVRMFAYCGNLEFRTPLPNLIDGKEMFFSTKLDVEGIKIIAESLKDMTNTDSKKKPTITLGEVPRNRKVEHYLKMIRNKGWEVECWRAFSR